MIFFTLPQKTTGLHIEICIFDHLKAHSNFLMILTFDRIFLQENECECYIKLKYRWPEKKNIVKSNNFSKQRKNKSSVATLSMELKIKIQKTDMVPLLYILLLIMDI